MLPVSGWRVDGRAEVLYTHHHHEIEPVVLLVPQDTEPSP
jgi:hypothetical protein